MIMYGKMLEHRKLKCKQQKKKQKHYLWSLRNENCSHKWNVTERERDHKKGMTCCRHLSFCYMHILCSTHSRTFWVCLFCCLVQCFSLSLNAFFIGTESWWADCNIQINRSSTLNFAELNKSNMNFKFWCEPNF